MIQLMQEGSTHTIDLAPCHAIVFSYARKPPSTRDSILRAELHRSPLRRTPLYVAEHSTIIATNSSVRTSENPIH
eukprot:scaffold44505_cov153-Skeletonema_marinoi.AAC.7